MVVRGGMESNMVVVVLVLVLEGVRWGRQDAGSVQLTIS